MKTKISICQKYNLNSPVVSFTVVDCIGIVFVRCMHICQTCERGADENWLSFGATDLMGSFYSLDVKCSGHIIIATLLVDESFSLFAPLRNRRILERKGR